MRISIILKKVTLIIILAIITVPSIIAQPAIDLSGTWSGPLTVGNNSLKIVFRITENPYGGYSGFLDSPDQGAFGLALDTVIIIADSVEFQLKTPPASFSGMFIQNPKALTGYWNQGGMRFPLTLGIDADYSTPRRPQEPVPPFPYDTTEVSFRHYEKNISFSGILTTPKPEVDKKLVVILVSGSGPQDRDGAVFGHKNFLVLADRFAKSGISTLRFDERGVGKSTGIFAGTTTPEFATDVLSAVEFLAALPKMDGCGIGLLGLSEGGIILPLVANSSDKVSFLVLLAGPATSGKDILLKQTELVYRAEGAEEPLIEAVLGLNKIIYETIAQESDSLKMHEIIMERGIKYLRDLPEPLNTLPVFSKQMLQSTLDQALSPWFRFFISYDPGPALESLEIPTLALYGTNDLQVSAKQNISVMKKYLETSGIKNSKALKMDGLNHLFQKSDTGAISEYAGLEETFNEEAISLIINWIILLKI